MGKDITGRYVAVVGEEEIGQIVFSSSDGCGSSPDLHKLSFPAHQLSLLPLLLAPMEQVNVKHWLKQLNHPDDGLAGSKTKTLQSIHPSKLEPAFFCACCRSLNLCEVAGLNKCNLGTGCLPNGLYNKRVDCVIRWRVLSASYRPFALYAIALW